MRNCHPCESRGPWSWIPGQARNDSNRKIEILSRRAGTQNDIYKDFYQLRFYDYEHEKANPDSLTKNRQKSGGCPTGDLVWPKIDAAEASFQLTIGFIDFINGILFHLLGNKGGIGIVFFGVVRL